MANIYHYETKNGKFWGVRGYLGIDKESGKQKEVKKRGFKTKKEAQLFASRAKHDFVYGLYDSKNNNFTYEQVYHEWLEQYKLDVKESTLAKTKKRFELHILPAIGSVRLQNISSKLLQEIVNGWHTQFKQYKMVFNYMNMVLDYSVLQGYIIVHPKLRVAVPTKKLDYGYEKTSKDFYTKGELQKLFAVLEQEASFKWHALFRLLAFTGIRRGELLALTWNDISFKDKTLDVNKALSLGLNNKQLVLSPKSEAGYRVITMDDITLDILKQWQVEQAKLLIGFGFNARKPEQLLFSKYETNKHLDLSAPRNKLERLCRLNDLDMINIHGFRHTHCSLLFEAGVPMKDVKVRLGHSDIAITMNIYTHVTKDSEVKSAELFANYVNF